MPTATDAETPRGDSAIERTRFTAHLAAATAVVLWGLSFVATKVVLAEIGPTTLVFTRFAIGCLFLFVLLVVRGGGGGRPRLDGRAVAWMGFFGIFLHQMLQVYGLRSTTATHTGWLIALIPIWAAILGAAFLGERPGAGTMLGLALGLGGALVVVVAPTATAGASLPRLATGRGDLLVIASTINWAAYTVYGRRLLRRGGGLPATAWGMAAGTLMLAVPFATTRGWTEWGALDGRSWAALLFLAVGCSGIAYLCWFVALERLEAASVAAWLYLEPFVTQVAAALLLSERVSKAVLAGGMIVLAGVWLVQRREPASD